MADTTGTTFTINGNTVPIPSEVNWDYPKMRGVDGNGMPRYEPYSQMNLNWNRLLQSDFYTLFRIWQGHYNSGTAVITLPNAVGSDYGVTVYSGVYLDMPQSNAAYDTNYLSDIRMIVRKVTIV